MRAIGSKEERGLWKTCGTNSATVIFEGSKIEKGGEDNIFTHNFNRHNGHVAFTLCLTM